MDSVDLMVLRTLRDWRLAGRGARLVTVLRTWGSSPRPPGSILALADDGELVGSVSGGCIEDDLIHRYANPDQGSGRPEVLRYGLSADEAHRFGLPCGGTMELLVERDPRGDELDTLVCSLSAGRLVRRRVRLRDGWATLEEADQPEGLRVSADCVAQTFGPGWRMLLIGAGQLAEYLATMATFNGFAVTVCDPREQYRASWRVDAATLVHDMPDDAVTAFCPDRRSAVIALTHDPKLDDLALMDALQTQAFYVGAIGSRRNSEARRHRLAEHFGLTAGELQRLRGPIGLYIGSKTPPEIAVSVMAEVLAAKNGVVLPARMGVQVAKDLMTG